MHSGLKSDIDSQFSGSPVSGSLAALAPRPFTEHSTLPDLPGPNQQGLGTAYANANKWFAYLPLEDTLGKRYSNLNLHIVNFSLPQMQMSTTTVSYKGYDKKIPTKVMNGSDKELTLSYIVDAKWQNYKSLYLWMSGVEGTLNPTVKETTAGITPSNYISLRIYLLDPYKNKVIQFVFEHCFVLVFNDLALEANNPEELHHSFTLAYDSFYIENV